MSVRPGSGCEYVSLWSVRRFGGGSVADIRFGPGIINTPPLCEVKFAHSTKGFFGPVQDMCARGSS
jgi:hypothetical protein